MEKEKVHFGEVVGEFNPNNIKDAASDDEGDGQAGESNQIDWANLVLDDGKKFADLSPEDKKKMKKKLKKKEKKTKEVAEKKAYEELIEKQNEGKDKYQIEVDWCINQLKLGLTNPGVDAEQSKI